MKFSATTQIINCPKCSASILLYGDTMYQKLVSAEIELASKNKKLAIAIEALEFYGPLLTGKWDGGNVAREALNKIGQGDGG